jgi:hypothetical protein
MSNSLYYGRPVSANAFPGYSTAELESDLASDKLDAATRAAIETEIARRRESRRTRTRRAAA